MKPLHALSALALIAALALSGCADTGNANGPTLGSSSAAPSTGPSTTGTNGPGPGGNLGAGPIGGSGGLGPR